MKNDRGRLEGGSMCGILEGGIRRKGCLGDESNGIRERIVEIRFSREYVVWVLRSRELEKYGRMVGRDWVIK